MCRNDLQTRPKWGVCLNLVESAVSGCRLPKLDTTHRAPYWSSLGCLEIAVTAPDGRDHLPEPTPIDNIVVGGRAEEGSVHPSVLGQSHGDI